MILKNTRKEQEIFEDISVLCQSKGYAHVIAFFCFRDNLIGYKDELKASDYAKHFLRERLIRTEVSTLIGLMAKGSIDLSVPTPQDTQIMIERSEALLQELHEAMMAPFTEIFRTALSDPQRPSPLSTAEAMREPIFYGAESAYAFQYRDISQEKYSRDGGWLETNKGFSILEARQVVTAIASVLSIKSITTLRELAGKPLESWTVLPAFEFSTEDVVIASGLESEKVQKVIEAFSFVGNSNAAFTSLHEFNETNAGPIMRIGKEQYVLFQYASLAEALYDTPYYWMGADKSYRETALTHRGLFTEQFSLVRLSRVFGKERVYRNVDIWRNKAEKLGEIDALVLFGDHAIVAQAKSKKLTLAARKGNDLQLRGDFKSAVQDAADQALLCGSALNGTVRVTDAEGAEIDVSQITKVYPICIVADHYPALTFQAQHFLESKNADLVQKPIICDVFWLDVVTEMLDTPLRFLSYLELRTMIGDNVLISHENVALGYHLKRNLWLGKYDLIQLHDDLTVDLDIAMAVRREGIKGEATPKGILTEFKNTRIGKIVSEIERREEPALIGLGLELLKLNGKTVKEISAGIDKIAKVGAKDGRQHDLTVSIGKNHSGLTVHANDKPDDVAFQNLRNHCKIRKYSQKASLWHGLCVEPGDAALRFGVMLNYPWEEDPQLEQLVEGLPKPTPAKKLPEMIKKLAPKKKYGRNEKCPCGSGLKYKKCCLKNSNSFITRWH